MNRKQPSLAETPSTWLTGLTVALLALLAYQAGSLGKAGEYWRPHALIHITFWSLTLMCVMKAKYLRFSPGLLLLLALTLRLLYLPIPVSDDVARYVWEGELQVQGHNPYHLPPQHHSLTHLRDHPVWDDINHKDKTAIYPPGFQLLMHAASWAQFNSAQLKLTFLLIDFLNVILILKLLALHRKPAYWALLYIANPMVLMSFAGETHLDVLMVFGMLWGLLAFQQRRWRSMFLALAFAIHIKYFAALLLPFLLRRENARYLLWLILPAILPFFMFTPIAEIFNTLQTFGQEMHFNGSIHALLGHALDNFPLAAAMMAVSFILLAGFIRIKTPNPLIGGALIFFALLICSPNVHVWYLSWLAPFLVFVPLRAGLVWMGTIALAYHAPGMAYEQGHWAELPVWTWIAYLPVFVALLYDLRYGSLAQPKKDQVQLSTDDVSIIVPTLNEAERLPSFLAQLQSLCPAPSQVVFSDGGSTDETLALLKSAGHTLVSSNPGRGTQIHTALSLAQGSTLLILHADMQLKTPTLQHIVEQLNQRDAVGGALGCQYRTSKPFLRIISLANRIRAQWFGVAFGDQAIFFRADSLAEMGGFPNIPIMEDVECSLRIRERGPFLYLNYPVSVSDRQWRKRSSVGHTLLVIRLLIRYFYRRVAGKAAPHVQDLYNAYYQKSTNPVL